VIEAWVRRAGIAISCFRYGNSSIQVRLVRNPRIAFAHVISDLQASRSVDWGASGTEGIGNQGSVLNKTSVDMSEREIDRGT